MKIKTTYEKVKLEYPDALKELESKLRNGTSNKKNKPLEEFEFSFQVAERIESNFTLDDLLNGEAQIEQKKETVDEVVERRVNNSTVYIEMKLGRCRYTESLDEIPTEVADKYRESEEEQRKEDERFDNLSEEEQQKEINESIEELRKMGGFTAIGIKK